MNLKGKVLISGISSAVITTGGIFIYNIATKPSSKSKEVSEDSQKDAPTVKDSVVKEDLQPQTNDSIISEPTETSDSKDNPIVVKTENDYIDGSLESSIPGDCKTSGEESKCMEIFNWLKDNGKCIVKLDNGSGDYDDWYLNSDEFVGIYNELVSNVSKYKERCSAKYYLQFKKEGDSWKFVGFQ